MTYAFRAHPVMRRRRLAVAVLIALALLIAAAARFIWRKLRPPRDSDGHDHTPPEMAMPITVTRLCQRKGCTNPLPASAGPRAMYCSAACRTAAYRERRAAA